jgi:uncharacterized protein (TIGR03083 family)
VESGWFDLGRRATNALAETWGSLVLACDNLSETEWETATTCPGWSVRDQLSHLIGIERTLEGEASPEWQGALGPHVKTPFAEGNEKWIAVRRARPPGAVLSEFVEVTARRLATLEAMSPGEWAQVGPSIVGDVPYAEFMRVRVFDSWVHEQDVRLALGRPGGSGGVASALAVDQVQAAMGFVVGKQAAAPEGTVVCFSLSGPALDARQIIIAVEGGRARPVPPASTPAPTPTPTVTLILSSLDFVRLGCGRVAAAVMEESGRAVVEGDQVLGGRILESMNFMF